MIHRCIPGNLCVTLNVGEFQWLRRGLYSSYIQGPGLGMTRSSEKSETLRVPLPITAKAGYRDTGLGSLSSCSLAQDEETFKILCGTEWLAENGRPVPLSGPHWLLENIHILTVPRMVFLTSCPLLFILSLFSLGRVSGSTMKRGDVGERVVEKTGHVSTSSHKFLSLG